MPKRRQGEMGPKPLMPTQEIMDRWKDFLRAIDATYDRKELFDALGGEAGCGKSESAFYACLREVEQGKGLVKDPILLGRVLALIHYDANRIFLDVEKTMPPFVLNVDELTIAKAVLLVEKMQKEKRKAKAVERQKNIEIQGPAYKTAIPKKEDIVRMITFAGKLCEVLSKWNALVIRENALIYNQEYPVEVMRIVEESQQVMDRFFSQIDDNFNKIYPNKSESLSLILSFPQYQKNRLTMNPLVRLGFSFFLMHITAHLCFKAFRFIKTLESKEIVIGKNYCIMVQLYDCTTNQSWKFLKRLNHATRVIEGKCRAGAVSFWGFPGIIATLGAMIELTRSLSTPIDMPIPLDLHTKAGRQLAFRQRTHFSGNKPKDTISQSGDDNGEMEDTPMPSIPDQIGGTASGCFKSGISFSGIALRQLDSFSSEVFRLFREKSDPNERLAYMEFERAIGYIGQEPDSEKPVE